MILQAIVTKYLGPTNTRGARVKAMADAGSKTLEWDSNLNVETNHARAALALATKLKWDGKYVGGATPGAGYCFVNAGRGVYGPADCEVEFEVGGHMLYLRGLAQDAP